MMLLDGVGGAALPLRSESCVSVILCCRVCTPAAAAAAAGICCVQTRLERAGGATFVTLLEMQAKNR
jgi:hypothetical protein